MYLVILSIFFNYAFAAHEHLLMQKIQYNSFSGLEEIIEKNNSWHNYKNSSNKSVVEAIIDQLSKNINSKKYCYLLHKIIQKKEIIISDKQLDYLINKLIKFKEYKKNNKNDLSLAKELILIACNLEKNQIDSIKKISKIINLFCLKTNIAYSLIDLYKEKIINNDQLNSFLINYNYLFFEDKIPSKKTFYFIFKAIKKHCDYKFLFEFILNFYEKKHNNFSDIQTITINNNDFSQLVDKDSYGLNIKTVSDIINYLDIEDFSQALPKKILNLNNKFFNNIKQRQEKIRDFIIDTILFAKNIKDQKINYIYWTKIYDNLKNRGNLQGAFNIALALHDSKIPIKIINSLSHTSDSPANIIDHSENYKYYRDSLERSFNNKMQPSIVIIQKDLIGLKEAFKLALQDKKLEEFLENNLDIYLNLKEKFKQIYNFNTQFNVKIKNSFLMNMFKNPINKDNINFVAYYAFLMPKPSIKYEKEYPKRKRSTSYSNSQSVILGDDGQKKIEYRVDNPKEIKKVLRKNNSINFINTANFIKEEKPTFNFSPRRRY